MATLEMTTVARVKQYADITNTDKDSLILLTIRSVGLRMEKSLARTVLRGTHTDVLSSVSRQQHFRLKAFPVSSITSVKWEYYGRFTDGSVQTLTQGTDYHLVRGGAIGVLHLDSFYDEGRPGSLQVVYVGGMAATTEELEDSYPDLVMAATMQSAHEFRRRANLGLRTVTSGSESVEVFRDMKFLPEVREVLDTYTRKSVL